MMSGFLELSCLFAVKKPLTMSGFGRGLASVKGCSSGARICGRRIKVGYRGFWELRAVAALAKLWANQGRRDERRDLLAPSYAGFIEGFETADLKAAKTLLDALA